MQNASPKKILLDRPRHRALRVRAAELDMTVQALVGQLVDDFLSKKPAQGTSTLDGPVEATTHGLCDLGRAVIGERRTS